MLHKNSSSRKISTRLKKENVPPPSRSILNWVNRSVHNSNSTGFDSNCVDLTMPVKAIEGMPTDVDVGVSDICLPRHHVPLELNIKSSAALSSSHVEDQEISKRLSDITEISPIWDMKISSEISELVTFRQQSITDFITAGGVIKKRATFSFQHEPRYLSDPKHAFLLEYVRPRDNASRGSSDTTYLQLRAETCARKLRCSKVNFEAARYGNERFGVSSIRFDASGVLFAAVGSNGIIRVFDFIECAAKLQFRHADTVPTVAVVDARKEISDICWSNIDSDDIAISFQSYPMIHIYDLNDTEQPKMILEVGRELTGGHSVLRYFNEPKSTYGTSADNHSKMSCGSGGGSGGGSGAEGASKRPRTMVVGHIVAGTAHGRLRMWKTSKPKQVMWEIAADPSVAASCASPVVGIVQLPSSDGLVSLTKSGVLTIFDMCRLVLEPFKSTGVPSLVKRVLVWEEHARMGFNFQALDICMPFKTDSEVVTISSSGGEVFRFNVATEKTTPTAEAVEAGRKKSMAAPLAQEPSGALVSADISEGQCTRRLGPPCKPAFPSWPGDSLYCTGVRGTNFLTVHELPEHSRITFPYARSMNSTSASFRNASGDSVGGGAGGAKNAYIKCRDIAMTLPGHIIEAHPGSHDVIVSHDLRDYLAARLVASSLLYRSDRIYFDWSISYPSSPPSSTSSSSDPTTRSTSCSSDTSTGPRWSLHSGEGLEDELPYVDCSGRRHVGGIEAAVEHIAVHLLTLSEPYCGPTVEKGQPKVRLRTNLVPRGSSSSSSSSSSNAGSGATGTITGPIAPRVASSATSARESTIHGASGSGMTASNAGHKQQQQQQHVAELHLSSPVTAIGAHPFLPYLLVGTQDNNIVLMASDVSDDFVV